MCLSARGKGFGRGTEVLTQTGKTGISKTYRTLQDILKNLTGSLKWGGVQQPGIPSWLVGYANNHDDLAALAAHKHLDIIILCNDVRNCSGGQKVSNHDLGQQ